MAKVQQKMAVDERSSNHVLKGMEVRAPDVQSVGGEVQRRLYNHLFLHCCYYLFIITTPPYTQTITLNPCYSVPALSSAPTQMEIFRTKGLIFRLQKGSRH